MEYKIVKGGEYANRITYIQGTDDYPEGGQEGLEPETF